MERVIGKGGEGNLESRQKTFDAATLRINALKAVEDFQALSSKRFQESSFKGNRYLYTRLSVFCIALGVI